ncbi:hypothetical protein ACFX13_021441 [Malus domestica]|uniref:uncharacterized protein n=1 Tax=Malus domestica TaxID=3750 RepID=UPI0039757C3F
MPSDSSLFLLLLFSIAFNLLSLAHATIGSEESGGGIGRRALLSLKETPHGSNATYECSPAGPCVPCLYPEKKDEKYRCSETGYRIPLKCVEMKHGSKEAKMKGAQKSRSALEISHNIEESDKADNLGTYVKHRSLLDDSSTQEPQAYITYRSCIPAVNEEKLSVLGFEVIVLFLLLISGSLVYFRRKQTTSTAGFVRIQNNSRF